MSASACQQKHELSKKAMLLLTFHFYSVLLIFVNLWPISTLCVADMVHLWPIWFVADMVVADMVCGRYRRFPFHEFLFIFLPNTDVIMTLLQYFVSCITHSFQL